MTKGDETAFPARGVIEGMAWATEGVTKREIFAAIAMQGKDSANYVDDFGDPLTGAITKSRFEYLAEECVAMADALIEALNKQ